MADTTEPANVNPESVYNTLALRIAQLELDNAILKARLETLQTASAVEGGEA